MMKLLFAILVSGAWSVGAHADFKEAWQKQVDEKQASYVAVEVNEAKDLLAAGIPSPLCGYASTGTWASTSLRNMLFALKKEVKSDLLVSQPAMDLTTKDTICVTVTLKK